MFMIPSIEKFTEMETNEDVIFTHLKGKMGEACTCHTERRKTKREGREVNDDVSVGFFLF
jgi:hypothetical protein